MQIAIEIPGWVRDEETERLSEVNKLKYVYYVRLETVPADYFLPKVYTYQLL